MTNLIISGILAIGGLATICIFGSAEQKRAAANKAAETDKANEQQRWLYEAEAKAKAEAEAKTAEIKKAEAEAEEAKANAAGYTLEEYKLLQEYYKAAIKKGDLTTAKEVANSLYPGIL